MNTFLKSLKKLIPVLLLLSLIACQSVPVSRHKEGLAPVRIFIAGDSTASTYEEDRAPRTGWGQVLEGAFYDAVTVINDAASGRSSKSFIDEGKLAAIEAELKPGDYLLVQFGHNDEKSGDPSRYTEPSTTFKAMLKQYIEAGKKHECTVILITPISRRSFDAEGKIKDTHGDYPEAMIELGKEMDVPVIDMTTITKEILEKAGYQNSKKYHLWGKKGELPNYPNGVADDTHLNRYGAETYAKIIAQELAKKVPALAEYVLK